ncbi:NlpC/P60 family protein [Clostridium sp. WILCCON 0269]|uniref:NlpC/P60 family protein n=1 Tax=Candidatus Clostridium eludens TaxID=3381663 RepID=A0ABW8SI06_9CLOT
MIRKNLWHAVIILGIVSTITFHAGASPIEEYNISNISNTSNVTNNISNLDEDTLNITNQKTNIEKQIEIQDSNIESNITALNSYKENLKKLNSDISENVQSIAYISKNINDLNAISNQRIRALYVNGCDESYLNVILDSKNFTDLVSNTYLVKKLMDWDRKNIETLEANKDILQNKTKKLNSDKSELDKLTKKVSDETDVLKMQKENEEKLIGDLDKMIVQNKDVNSGNTDNSIMNTGNSIVDYALSFLGVPYVWGGTTPSGFDCSGFVQYVYGHFGISIPRVSQDQQNFGTKILDVNDLQPGDLVFWGNPAYHVGMYIGNGKYVEAPHTGDVVKIATLYDYTSAQRIK